MENLNLGRCCICERENETVRNVITLDKKLPAGETKGGWGCFVCGLDALGAVAVLCDECLEKNFDEKVEINFACLGYPGENRRIEMEKLTKIYRHIESKHPETWNWNAALNHFRAVRKSYQELNGTPGVNVTLALEHVFRPLSERYHRGERSRELYDEMMAVE